MFKLFLHAANWASCEVPHGNKFQQKTSLSETENQTQMDIATTQFSRHLFQSFKADTNLLKGVSVFLLQSLFLNFI